MSGEVEKRLSSYHGGVPGLKIGELVLPPTETGAMSSSDFGACHVHRRDRVYVSSDPLGAAIFAALHPSGKGCVYEVRPLGDIEPDPDCDQPGLSWQCERATVLRRVRVPRKYLNHVRREMLGGEAR